MAALRIFSYLPNPRVWKATIAGRFCEVEVEVRQIEGTATTPSLDEIYALLSERFDSGEHDVAARHNEHQP